MSVDNFQEQSEELKTGLEIERLRRELRSSLILTAGHAAVVGLSGIVYGAAIAEGNRYVMVSSALAGAANGMLGFSQGTDALSHHDQIEKLKSSIAPSNQVTHNSAEVPPVA